MNRTKYATKKITLTGVLAALLIGGMWALKPIPNVEIVTILLACFAFVFGPFVSVPAAAILVLEEAIVWGFNTWVISYFIYWPLVALVFSLLGFLGKKRNNPIKLTIAPTATAVSLTAFFGVLTTFIDLGLFSGFYQNFWTRFAVIYGQGIPFFTTQIICNLVLFPVAFVPLTSLLSALKVKYFPPAEIE